jgi:hypothetical protein
VAAPSRPPNRGEQAGNSPAPAHARGASSPTRGARVELSPRGVSPRCIMTGRHTCKPSLKARFRAGVCRTSTFATVCTAGITSPRCPSGFRQLFCLTKPRRLAPPVERLAAGCSWCGICAQGLTVPRSSPTRFEVHKPHHDPSDAHRDRQVAVLFFLVASATVSAQDRRGGPHPRRGIHCGARRRSFALRIKFTVARRTDLTNASHSPGS